MIRLKVNPGDATWAAPVADGHLWLRSSLASSGWYAVTSCRVRASDGAYWIDTGYVGFPLAPSGTGISDWDTSGFGYVAVSFQKAIGGPAVDLYQVHMTGSSVMDNNYTFTPEVPNGATLVLLMRPLQPDGTYYFAARSRTPGGLFSPWSNAIGVQMGHAAGWNGAFSAAPNRYVSVPFGTFS